MELPVRGICFMPAQEQSNDPNKSSSVTGAVGVADTPTSSGESQAGTEKPQEPIGFGGVQTETPAGASGVPYSNITQQPASQAQPAGSSATVQTRAGGTSGGLPPTGAPTGGGSVVQASKPSRRFALPKKLFVFIGVILLLLAIAYAVVKFVLPRLDGVSDQQANNITWWGLWEDDVVVTPIIAEYESQNPGVTVNYVKQSKEDYRERLTNA